MYRKLAFRNAKRSIFNYLLYMTTMTILLAIMCVANYIAVFGDMEAGFQTTSLPLLIVFIMVSLVNYINAFMLNQRAKEFATYMLLGMEKSKLLKMFLLEFGVIGVLCFFVGSLVGTAVFYAAYSNALQSTANGALTLKSVVFTLFFFCVVEVLSAVRIKKKIYRLQVNELMNEKRRNQALRETKRVFWGAMLTICLSAFILMLCGIVFLPEHISFILVSFISLPMLGCIFAFYKWLYAHWAAKRVSLSEDLYRGNRLYRIAEMTSATKTSALMNAVFCTCLLFSASCFVFGALMFNEQTEVFARSVQQWMGFVQISICIVFITIYFSILSLQQIIELRRQSNNIRVLHYIGKSEREIKALMITQILLKLFMPTLMCFVLLLIGVPFVNYKINMAFPISMHNALIKAVAGFAGCFAVLYLCYFFIVYIVSKRYVKGVVNL